jgi:hypothetical protein
MAIVCIVAPRSLVEAANTSEMLTNFYMVQQPRGQAPP